MYLQFLTNIDNNNQQAGRSESEEKDFWCSMCNLRHFLSEIAIA